MTDETTTSTARRWQFTNDVLAGVLVLSTVGAVAWSLSTTGEVPRMLLGVFAFESLLAAGWAFGRETLAAVAEVVPSPYGQPARSTDDQPRGERDGGGSS